ncbi:MAG: hypothetical protein J6R82_07900 [Clostridia bacterium]|nr:hypothetical protein [Clostridia bacterium]
MMSTNSDRLYKLLGDLSPKLLADAFPEKDGNYNAPSFRARHAKKIGKMALLYAACAVLLIGAVLYLPGLADRLLPFSPMSQHIDFFNEWQAEALEVSDAQRDLVNCMDGTTDTPFLYLKENRVLHLQITCRHQGATATAYSHTYQTVHLEVLLDGKWYRLPAPNEQGLCQIIGGITQLNQIGQTLSLEYTLSRESYGNLPAGNYRAAVEFFAEHSAIYMHNENHSGAVYIPFTITDDRDGAPLVKKGKLNPEALVVAQSSVPACCYEGTTDTPLICLSESRQIRSCISHRYPYCEFEVEEHHLQIYSEPELQYYEDGIWYALPCGNAGASQDSTLIRSTIDNSTLIPESLAKKLPTGKYRAVYRVHVIHKQSLDKMNPDEDYVGAIYVDFHVVDDRQNPILYANGSGGWYTNSWYDFEAHSRGERPLGKVYRGKFDPYDQSNPDARYAVELYYIDSDYTARPLDAYLKHRGFEPIEINGKTIPLYALTETEMDSITPQSVQKFYQLDTAPAITIEHKPQYTDRQDTLYRVDLIWEEEHWTPQLMYNRIIWLDELDPENKYPQAGDDYPYAVNAFIMKKGERVSAADYFRSLGWEVLPDYMHDPQGNRGESVALLVATRNQLWSITLEEVAAFYGCDPEEIGVSLDIAVHAPNTN